MIEHSLPNRREDISHTVANTDWHFQPQERLPGPGGAFNGYVAALDHVDGRVILDNPDNPCDIESALGLVGPTERRGLIRQFG
ncbi:hypothetical protein YM304_36560 [Ilumatobacter coccineus YM16-304]|uniref:Uncharacterized protein n=1 Tax=Ilumatobacter coccineus (strain NBRC 103263 / KCTC 29153 / YM16-304) TaxID=1313172 RepID=A0A6C7EC59_ILUCY|nr:hypothetical protein YM304_36560 [Ilumatobacter coccineus YM16-304]